MDGLAGDLRLLARLTLESLLRLSEGLSLRREDFESTAVMIVNSKAGKARRVPLTPELRTALLARCHKSGYVFGVGERGEPATQEATSVAFTRAIRALGLSGISHHTFRHTGATIMKSQRCLIARDSDDRRLEHAAHGRTLRARRRCRAGTSRQSDLQPCRSCLQGGSQKGSHWRKRRSGALTTVLAATRSIIQRSTLRVPIVQRPRTWPFQGQNTGSNPVGDVPLLP